MKKQSGFTLVEGLLIVLIIAVVSFAGYYVWQKQNSSDDAEIDSAPTSQNSQIDENQQIEESTSTDDIDISADWVRLTSGNNGFSIKIANGMTGFNDSTSDFIIVRSYSADNSVASIEDVAGYGSDAHSVLSIYYAVDSQSFSSTEKLDFKEVAFTTSAGVTGVKQTFKTPYSPPCEGPGCYVGTEYTNYEIKNNNTGKTAYIVYSRRMLNTETAKIFDLKADDPDLSVEVDAIVNSLEFN